MAEFVFKRVTKAYSDRVWLVIVYDYMHKITDEDAKKVNPQKYEYKSFQDAILWSEAGDVCKDWGNGTLASIVDEEEYNLIKGMKMDD